MESTIDHPPAHIVQPGSSPAEDGITMLRALADMDPHKAASVRSRVEDFLAAQIALTTHATTHEVYDVINVSVVPHRPQDRAEIATGEMTAVPDVSATLAAERQQEADFRASVASISQRRADRELLERARLAAEHRQLEDPMDLPLVRSAVRRMAAAGDLGALDLLERYSDGVSGRLGMVVTRAAASWSPLRSLANRFPIWV